MIFDGVKGVIFDFDGTLADSLGVWEDIDIKFMAKRGLYVPENYFEAVSAMNLPQAADYTIKALGLSETPEEIMAEWCEMAVEEYSENVALKPFAKEFVSLLRERGIKTAVATANERELLIPALRNNGAEELFDAVATTSEVKRGKGFPDVYDLAAERLGVPPSRCAVIEDIPAGVTGAKSGGYITVGIYDKRSERYREEMKKTADHYVSDFIELSELLKK